ncbi:MAG: response regulator [Arcobacter sp.]|uniref:response regulator n=1 Tax=Arcobacter sp. TaxID=1872629 RepID=UPI003B00E324
MAKVLVVDDARIMRINIGNILKSRGHEVIAEAENGYEAIEMYRKHEPDIVTMDITMPDTNNISDGIEAVKAIKGEFPDAKIIMITSHGEEEKVITAIQNGASNYLLKPIQVKKLEEVFEKTLNKQLAK